MAKFRKPIKKVHDSVVDADTTNVSVSLRIRAWALFKIVHAGFIFFLISLQPP